MSRLTGLVAHHGNPLHHPALWPVIRNGIVLAGTVVPESDGTGLPLQPNLVLGAAGGVLEYLQEFVAFLSFHTQDVVGKGDIDVEALALRGVGPGKR